MSEAFIGLIVALGLAVYLVYALLHPRKILNILESDAMTTVGWLQIFIVIAAVLLAAWPLGLFMAQQFSRPEPYALESGIYRIAGLDPKKEQSWGSYTIAMLALNAVGFVLLYGLQRLQGFLPLDPQGFGAVSEHLAFNTAMSFVTNTNWQSYGGETTLSHLVQMAGLTVQNFLSAATGIALAVAVTRAFARSSAATLGNFWVDVTRITLYVLLPLSIVVALAFAGLGVTQTLQGSVEATTLEGAKRVIAVGPTASQEAIKQLGTNGGGFFNVNAAHPFENPNAWSNYLSIFAMLLVSAAMPIMFGRMVGEDRQGRALLIAMFVMLIAATGFVYWAEAYGNPLFAQFGIDGAGGNMEGKEVRFGLAMTALYVAATTGLSCGAVNAMHGSLTPLGGLVPLFLIQLGEILPGGVGSGLYGIIVMAILTVFIAGLMVGRTPDYLGKKIEAREMKLAVLAILILPLVILGFTAISAVLPQALSSLANPGPHGLTEILYAYSSGAGNNGSAFAGLNANTPWFNTTLGIAMFFGRFAYIVPVMAIAGSLAAKKKAPQTAGSFPTHGTLFIALLIGVILILGGLQYFPALALGPIVEHFLMLAGQTFFEVIHMSAKKLANPSMFDTPILLQAVKDAFAKLNPWLLARNPVIFVTAAVAALVTALWLRDVLTANGSALFSGQIAAWLWFTVLFANFAEAVAEGRGKAQAETLRKTRTDTIAHRLLQPDERNDLFEKVSALDLRQGDVVIVAAGQLIPADGDIVEGIASVNESAITGESAPVIRESGGDRSAVTGGTTVLSDWIKVKITAAPGNTFIDRMIALVEGAQRKKTPNELALSILLAGMTLIFLFVVVSLWGLAGYSATILSVTVLVALLVTLIPTTIGGLLSAIGIAGMDRLIRFNVIATSGRSVEAAGDVDTLLLDKTGTVTYGNRLATAFMPIPGVTGQVLAETALLASLADETPEGRSIVALAKGSYGQKEPPLKGRKVESIPFSAATRISGVDLDGRSIRKGAVDAVLKHVKIAANSAPQAFRDAVDRISRTGGTPLAVSEDGRLLGVIHLKDVVKPDIKDRFNALRTMGIKTVMVTGDNPVTAAAIASEAGVDDFIAEATPEDKLAYIRAEQGKGRLIAMCGDGTNDAPALAQADVGVAMQSGTQAAREAGNMVDLDSNPTKLIEIVEIGKQLLMTRGSLTTFSIANDVAKYFAIIPALFIATYPQLNALNIMGLSSPQSAILSAVIFNALIIVALIPLALTGVAYRQVGAAALLRRNLLVYGVGGLVVPFVGIKIVDIIVAALNLA